MNEVTTPFQATPRPAALEGLAPDAIHDLDVRPILRDGGEPFAEIMAAVAALGPQQVLRLRAIFEPAPLYGALGRKGFQHWTERLAEDDWMVWFHRPAAIELDVRGMEPPEPMVRTLEALERLAPGERLVQVNQRVPKFLLPELDARGFTYDIQEEGPELVRLTIRRAPQAAAALDASVPAVRRERALDVRVIPPPEKHPAIFATFEALAPGESFVLVNDHDPKPLRYQFQAEHPGGYSWTYEESGPVVWRVRIGREVA